MNSWQPGPGVLELPSGLRVRGRSVRTRPESRADFSLYLLGFPPRAAGPHGWLCWPDFALPLQPRRAVAEIAAAHARLGSERVEVCCGGGIGRSGTVLAALTILDGLPLADAVAHVRGGYHPRAVETPWQRRFLRRFEPWGTPESMS